MPVDSAAAQSCRWHPLVDDWALHDAAVAAILASAAQADWSAWLGRARRVLFLVSGDVKRRAVAEWRAGKDIPARAIRPAAGVDVLVESALLLPLVD